MNQTIKTCRECGCTDKNPCTLMGVVNCGWIEDDLCTACAPVRQVLDDSHATFWLLAVLGAGYVGACHMATMLDEEDPHEPDVLVPAGGLILPTD